MGRQASAAVHAAHAEWTKLRTLPGMVWLLPALAALVAAVGAAVTGAVDTSHCPTPAACAEDTPKLALSGVQVGQVAAVVLGVLAVGGEYATGTIAPTFAAVPRRATVLAAKAAVVAGAVAAAAPPGCWRRWRRGAPSCPATGSPPPRAIRRCRRRTARRPAPRPGPSSTWCWSR